MLVRYGGGVLAASGSVGGQVFSRNRYGNYVRARTRPVNGQTDRQMAARLRMSGLVELWSTALTDDQRDAWNQYGAAISMTNRLGETIKLAGFNHFIRSNSCRLLVGATVILNAPEEATLPGADPSLAAEIDATDNKVEVSFDGSLPWVKEAGAYLLVYATQPCSSGRNFLFKRSRYAGNVAGVASTGAQSPAEIELPWEVGENEKMDIVCRILRADGRLSSPFRCRATYPEGS